MAGLPTPKSRQDSRMTSGVWSKLSTFKPVNSTKRSEADKTEHDSSNQTVNVDKSGLNFQNPLTHRFCGSRGCQRVFTFFSRHMSQECTCPHYWHFILEATSRKNSRDQTDRLSGCLTKGSTSLRAWSTSKRFIASTSKSVRLSGVKRASSFQSPV